jgi:hypothetical protein
MKDWDLEGTKTDAPTAGILAGGGDLFGARALAPEDNICPGSRHTRGPLVPSKRTVTPLAGQWSSRPSRMTNTIYANCRATEHVRRA